MKHLNEEQFVEWTSGERCDEAAQHLRECAQCMDEVRQLSLAFEGFKAGIHAQGAESLVKFTGTQIRALATATTRPATSRWKWMPVPALAALVLVVVIALPDRVQPPAPNTDAADEALLLAVNADVYRTSPAALRPAAELNKERNQILTSSQKPK